MKTHKLYYDDAYTRAFDARVISCEAEGERWRCVLDATAFFPTEGGQSADTGTLGGARVVDVVERSGVLYHLLASPLQVGETVHGELEWTERLRKMQSHSAEHILSGIFFRRFGYENVGFHLADCGFVFDTSGELDDAAIAEAEREANEIIWQNVPVTAWFPSAAELASLSYRSKLELTENVRLVRIGEIDLCACCAPHVARTGEIGMVKILEATRHRGGMRLRAKAGIDALAEFGARCAADGAVSRLLSVPQEDIASGVERLLAEREGLKEKLTAAQNALLRRQIEDMRPTDGHMLLFADCDMDGLRALCNAGAPLCGGVCAAFSGVDGDWRFVMASRTQDVRAFFATVRDSLIARGGGKAEMISGSSAASRAQLEACFAAGKAEVYGGE